MARVLLVEDDEAFRIFCGKAFSSAGWEVEEAGDGSEAVEKALRSPPDAIVLDLWLPGLTGSGVLRVLRANRRLDPVPVIVLSGTPEVKDRDGLLSFGADDVMEKPVSPEALVAKVEGWRAAGRRKTVTRTQRFRAELS
ncbi:MAG: response regulator [Planctomycetota bacterium]|jgi:two-component system phosphate regulon response regulator PhoB